MLGNWKPHKEYQEYVEEKLRQIAAVMPELIQKYEKIISKLYLLNLDVLKAIIAPLYSWHIGRKAEYQPEIFRAFIAMSELNICFNNWVEELRNNTVLREICGFGEKMPKTASYYDFINRLYRLEDRPDMKKFERKPTEKRKKGEKIPPKHPEIVGKLVDKIITQDRLFNNPAECNLQEIFAKVVVDESVKMGLISPTPDLSGDGTCVETGASHHGVKTCKCKDFKCGCPRRFSDPNATWGWDSHEEHYFYGYTAYFLSYYNKSLKTDLPLYLRFVSAARHDSVSAVVSLAEFIKLHPNLKINSFISDSAIDNYATYEMLDYLDIIALIALNPKNTGNFTYPPHISVTDSGVPVCPSEHEMVHWGYCPQKHAVKWRCPLILGKAACSQTCNSCSPSAYGRTIYTKPEWDLRLFTRIPRGSDSWKKLFNQRTASERINNRILNDYGLKDTHSRGKKRISFFGFIAAVNVHLDAWLSVCSSDISSLFSRIFAAQDSA
jgi:hypothetical protein